jgi:hypothetical protein
MTITASKNLQVGYVYNQADLVRDYKQNGAAKIDGGFNY